MTTTINPTTGRRLFEGEVETCAHRVTFFYDIYDLELTPEQEECLTEAAEERAKECITEGFISGQLVYCLGDDADTELFGWWQIARD